MNSTTKEAPSHLGHRARLRERFQKAGLSSVEDYELLEMLLFLTHPRRDTKPIAKNLLKEFGSLRNVLAAPIGKLMKTKHIGEVAATSIKVIEAMMVRASEEKIQEKDVMQSWRDVINHCRIAMSRKPVEELRILFLDQRNNLLKNEVLQTGTINFTAIYPREIVKRALELGASSIVMVHNHPSGDATPSQEDIKMTQKVQSALKAVDISLHDHMIVGGDDVMSFRAFDLLS